MIDKQKLERLYLTQKMSLAVIASTQNISYKTIQSLMKKYKIPLRKRGWGWYRQK